MKTFLDRIRTNKIEYPLYGATRNDHGVRAINYLFARDELMKRLPMLETRDIEDLSSTGVALLPNYIVYTLNDEKSVRDFLTGKTNQISLNFDHDPQKFIEVAQIWSWMTSPYQIDNKTRNDTIIKVMSALGIPVGEIYGKDREYEERSKCFDYDIYQVKCGGDISESDYAALAFEPYDTVLVNGVDIREDMYDLVYSGKLNGMTLEELFYKFNLKKPVDFTGHSMSVSDVISFSDNGEHLASFYVDKFGFKSIPEFHDIKQEHSHAQKIEPSLTL